MKSRIFSKAVVMMLATSSLTLTGCNDWLTLLPNSEQVTDDFWQSKEDVESVVASGYYYMRQSVPQMLTFGEVRAGGLYNYGSNDATKLQDFDILPSNASVKYTTFYQVINMANSVLRYARDVQDVDDTYYDALLNSHLCEAYFQRAYMYSLLVKNYKEVPLITSAYVNDDAEFKVAKSSESEIIAQIKADCLAALATGAAKGSYEEDWATKGRATKWSIYALLADICLWNHEYDECIKYADMILNATDALRPVFIADSDSWFDIFYPGNSNEGIFELNWDYATYTETNNFATYFPMGVIQGSTPYASYNVSEYLRTKMYAETDAINATDKTVRIGRMYLATFTHGSSITSYTSGATTCYIWKYLGSDIQDVSIQRTYKDANFILYRVADVKLMKAEALVMLGGTVNWKAAIEQINDIRERACLSDYVDLSASDATSLIENLDQYALLTEVLDQREMEFVGEAKRWYDLMRLARYDADFAPSGTVEDNEGQDYATYKTSGFGDSTVGYKQRAIECIQAANATTNDLQILSVLQNSWAWYLPLPYSEIEVNDLLKQNPFYN